MATSNKQKELDAIKWEKSVRLGMDACGTFDYCAKCDKSKENPCENAFNLTYSNEEVKKEPTKSVKKTTPKTAKTSTEKKTTAKKSTCKKTSKK